MPQWAKVVVYPLGLAGFALFVLFRFSETAWLPVWVVPAATFIALLGGLLLAFLDRSGKTKRDAKSGEPEKPITMQTSHGDQSPNVANVKDGVTITYGNAPSSDHRKK